MTTAETMLPPFAASFFFLFFLSPVLHPLSFCSPLCSWAFLTVGFSWINISFCLPRSQSNLCDTQQCTLSSSR